MFGRFKKSKGRNLPAEIPIPQISVAAIEQKIGFKAPIRYRPSVNEERKLVARLIRVKRLADKTAPNGKATPIDVVRAAMNDYEFKARLWELVVKLQYFGIREVKFPLPASHTARTFFEELVKRLPEVFPTLHADLANVKLPTYTVAFDGLEAGDLQHHLPQFPTKRDAEAKKA